MSGTTWPGQEIAWPGQEQPATLADVLASPEAQGADVPGGQANPPRMTMPTIAEARQALEPPEGFRTSSILPVAIREKETPGQPMQDIRWDWGPVRALGQPFLDLLEGTGQATSMGPGGGPRAGTVTPEGTMLLLGGAMGRPWELGRRGGPEPIPPGLAAREAPLSAEFQANPFARPQYGPPEAPAPAPAPAPTATPKTAAEAKAVANTWYKQHEAAGGAKLPPSFTNDFIDTVKRTAPQTEEGLVIGGETEVTKLIQRVEALRDKPISLAGAQEIDEALGNLIDKQYGVKGLSKEGNDLLDLQTSFREQLEKAAPAGDVGAVGGIDALTQARKAWSQAMKMGDLERIQLRASQTEQPSTEIRRGIRTLLGNERRSRGYTDEEKAALLRASKRGFMGEIFHTFGSRLVPIASTAGGFGGFGLGGVPGAILGTSVSLGGSTLSRNAATTLQSRRLGNALSRLGEGVPMPNVFAPPP